MPSRPPAAGHRGKSTAGTSLTAGYRATPDAELWNYGNDVYRGQTIERLDVARLGPGAPVPPGVSRLPGAGEYYASPALAALIRSVPADELGDRFPGHLAGTIGDSALTGPDELVIYVGYQPAQLGQARHDGGDEDREPHPAGRSGRRTSVTPSRSALSRSCCRS